MENLKEGTNDNGSIRVKQDEIVNNFIESLIILKITLEVIDIIIRLFDVI